MRSAVGLAGLALAACLAPARAWADAPPAPPPPPAAEVAAATSTLSSDDWWRQALGLDRAPLQGAPLAPVPRWSGDVLLRARGRYTGSDSDTDLYQYLRLRYRREQACGWSGSLYLRMSEDLDGLARSTSFFVFDSIDDTYRSSVLGRLYTLYANYRAAGGVLEQARIGRQDVVAGDLFHVDGVHLLLRPLDGSPTRFTVFGGIPTHLYESSIRGDAVVGGSAWFEPRCGTSIEVDDVWFQDENRVYGREQANLATLALTQQLRSWGTLRAGYQQLDADPRQAWGSIDATLPRYDLALRGALRTQILSENQQVYDIDPYYAILLGLEPYWEVQGSASKGLGRSLSAEVGGQLRRLYDDAKVGPFNHEFARVYGTLSARCWPRSGWATSLTGELWRTGDGENIGALGFEVEYKPGGRWRWTGGMDYALYRTDIYAVVERFDSYGWYLRSRYRPSGCWEWDGSVRVDRDDFDTYLTLNLALRFEF